MPHILLDIFGKVMTIKTFENKEEQILSGEFSPMNPQGSRIRQGSVAGSEI